MILSFRLFQSDIVTHPKAGVYKRRTGRIHSEEWAYSDAPGVCHFWYLSARVGLVNSLTVSIPDRARCFPPEIIQHAIWLYLRFTLSYRDVEELLAERGLDRSYETVRRWVLKFGPLIARRLRRGRPRPSDRPA